MNRRKLETNVYYPALSSEIDGFDSLVELALDMRWSWSHAEDELFRRLDPALWDLTHNPWVVLQTVSRDELKRALSERDFRSKVEKVLGARREAAEAPGWFRQCHTK